MFRQDDWPGELDRAACRSVFKAYDIRGLAGTPLSSVFAQRLGAALATHLDATRVVVGRDIRQSSPELHRALIAGMVNSGVEVIDIGIVSTGTMYHSTHTLDVDGGVMITASHNPPEYNGFKLNRGTAAMAGEEIQDLMRVFLEGRFKSGQGSVTHHEMVDAHIEAVLGGCDAPARRVSIALDCGNAVAGPAMLMMMQRLGVDVVPLFCEWDNTFPNHPPDPTRPENMVQLADAVREHGCEFGVGIDGDGDRVGIVDESGLFIHPDRMLGLFAIDVLREREHLSEEQRTVIYDVKCSMALEQAITASGGIPCMMRTGHSFQKQALAQRPGIPLAGEMSGHVFFNDRWPGFDDALYVTSRLVELASRSPGPFSALFASMPLHPATGEAKVPCPNDEKQGVMSHIAAAFQSSGMQLVTIDGVRATFEQDGAKIGWFLCRPSHTESILVMRAEATSEAGLEMIKARISELIGEHIDLSAFLE